MTKREMASLYRDPKFRAQKSFANPAGEVDEEELKMLAGGATPQAITPSSWVCGVASAAACPSTACSSEC